MLSPEGRCKTLDASADGYVRAEAAAALALTSREGSVDPGSPLGGTTTDPGSFLAVLAGSAVNQDGRSSALTAPNGPAQQRVLGQALQAAGEGAAAVSRLQMHGTGTPLGDPIEAGAAAAVLLGATGGRGEAGSPLVFASDKSGIGHTEPAAGL